MAQYLMTILVFIGFAHSSAVALTPFEQSEIARKERERAQARDYHARAVQFRNQGIQDHIYIFARQLRQRVNAESILCKNNKDYRQEYIASCDFTTAQGYACQISYGDSDTYLYDSEGYRTNTVRRVYLLICNTPNHQQIIRRIFLKPVP